jgi:protein ImuA
VRRLHLAAQSGAELGKCRPLGLLLTPGDGGAAGVETRYRMDPAHTPDSPRWRLDRLRARMAPPKSWQLGPNGPAKPQQP